MKGSGFSSWPTATAASQAQTADNPTPGQTGGTTLAGAADMMWFTPNVPNGGRTLQEGTSPTGMTPDGIKRQVGLENQTRLWTTPQAHDVTMRGSEQGFSHPAPETQPHGLPASQWRPTSRQLLRSAISHVAQRSLSRWLKRGNWRKRRLNPLFVEWLMGWPPGHALCDCSATEFARWQQHMRGALSAMPMAYGPWVWTPGNDAAPPEQLALQWGGPAQKDIANA